LLELMLNQKDHILQLPTSIRQAECTIQRFYLLLWPLLNLVEVGNYQKAKELTQKYVQLLLNSHYSLKIKVDCLIQLFNSVLSDSGIKAFAFCSLVEVCDAENCFDIITERAKSIVKDSVSWNLSKAERQDLYKRVGQVLDRQGLSSSAFHVMYSYLRLFEETDSALASAEDDARRSVILAIKAVDVVNFAELVYLPAIKQLTNKHAKVFSLLNLFTQASAADFKKQLNEYRDLMQSEGLTEQELVVKKSYVQICTLNTQVTNFSYTDLAQLLNVSTELKLCPRSFPSAS